MPQCPVQWCEIEKLKLVIVEIFTPWKLADATNRAFFPPPSKPVLKYLAHPWPSSRSMFLGNCYLLRLSETWVQTGLEKNIVTLKTCPTYSTLKLYLTRESQSNLECEVNLEDSKIYPWKIPLIYINMWVSFLREAKYHPGPSLMKWVILDSLFLVSF